MDMGINVHEVSKKSDKIGFSENIMQQMIAEVYAFTLWK